MRRLLGLTSAWASTEVTSDITIITAFMAAGGADITTTIIITAIGE